MQCVFFPSLLLQRSETACLHNFSVLPWNLSRLCVLDVNDDTPKRALFLTYTPLLLVQAVTCLKMNKKSVGGGGVQPTVLMEENKRQLWVHGLSVSTSGQVKHALTCIS